jgi:hypothetical protein
MRLENLIKLLEKFNKSERKFTSKMFWVDFIELATNNPKNYWNTPANAKWKFKIYDGCALPDRAFDVELPNNMQLHSGRNVTKEWLLFLYIHSTRF